MIVKETHLENADRYNTNLEQYVIEAIEELLQPEESENMDDMLDVIDSLSKNTGFIQQPEAFTAQIPDQSFDSQEKAMKEAASEKGFTILEKEQTFDSKVEEEDKEWENKET